MAGPFTYPTADGLPMDNGSDRNTILSDVVGDFIDEVWTPDVSEKPVFLANGEVDYIEFFKGPTQTTPNRLARIDITYDLELNPITEEWKLYDRLDGTGTTVKKTVTFTHSWLSAEITKTEMATV